MKRITLLTNPDVCNLHCPLCFLKQRNTSAAYGEMPFEIARKAIEKYGVDRDADGNPVLREVIPSTMGEPLLYSKFKDLLLLCRSKSLKMNLTTNGTFPGLWGTSSGMELLLAACTDIKVSYLAYEMGMERKFPWKENVERLLRCRRRLQEAGVTDVSKVSLQVTLHRENMDEVEGILGWAEEIGIWRIKWNPVVFLEEAPRNLRDRFELKESSLELLRQWFRVGETVSRRVKNEGSLFFGKALCPVGGLCERCPFADEVWVWPDGHEDHCPNPERRWGQA